MTSGAKWALGIIVVVVLAGLGLWKAGLLSTGTPPAAGGQEATTTQTQSGLPTSQSDASDAALTQDAAAVDAQMSGLSQDQADIGSSMDDQEVQQSSF